MPNHRLDLEYDGTDFHGWQVQPGRRTVQGELQRALTAFFDEEIRPVGAGRTDAGVHAAGQVASFAAAASRRPEALQRALAGLLPRDIRVLRVQLVPDEFSARHSALWRRYRYQMLRRTSVFSRRYFHELGRDLDVGAMAEAAACLRGAHDFAAFAASDAGEDTSCNVLTSRVSSAGAAVFFDITANHFLHHMVRRLAGMLVEVGRGRLAPAAAAELLRAGKGGRGGPRLPPQGLVLLRVGYPGDETAERVDAATSQSLGWLWVAPLSSEDA